MDARKIALLVVALIVAGGTAFFARTLFMQSAAPQSQAQALGPEILVATRALPVGTIIEPDSFRYQPWPKDLVENAYFTKGQADPASLAGTVVRAAVTAGQPLTQGALVKPGDRGFLAAALGPGMRAVTVSVSAQSGVAGFVFPGDRVDMVLTQQVAGTGGGPALKAAETVVRNIRVLATDQRTVTEDEEGKKVVQTFSNVTLEVTPRIAEKIAVAQAIGQISLSLRSIADNTAELERAIASGEVKIPEGADANAEKRVLLQVATRPIDTDPTFVTGGDVSRFQRRTVPSGNARGGEGGAAPAPRAAPAFVRPGEERPAYTGPVVRVARGNAVTDVTTGGK